MRAFSSSGCGGEHTRWQAVLAGRLKGGLANALSRRDEAPWQTEAQARSIKLRQAELACPRACRHALPVIVRTLQATGHLEEDMSSMQGVTGHLVQLTPENIKELGSDQIFKVGPGGKGQREALRV